jgi:hypothetical protein
MLGIATLLILFVVLKGVFRSDKVTDSSVDIRLDSLLNELSQDLRRSEENLLEKGSTALFQVSEAEVEVNFVLKRSTTKEGSVITSAVAIKAGEDYGQEKTHNIKVKLTPLPPRTGSASPEGDTQK